MKLIALLTFALGWELLASIGCGGGGPIILAPVGTMGYGVFQDQYSGASTTNHARSGGVPTNIRVLPTFNAPNFATVWLPEAPTIGTHLTSNIAQGHYYLQLQDVDGDSYGSLAGGGTIEISDFKPSSGGARGHVEGTFAGVVSDAYGYSVNLTNGAFSCDFDPAN